MPLPLAYFLTWTCYGQRLHGDERGSVDDEHNRPGTPYLPPDPVRERTDRARMTGPKVALSRPMREMAEGSIAQLCTERGWFLFTARAQQTHVHVVVNCRGEVGPERAEAAFKARITGDLRDASLAGDGQRLWTAKGSRRWINHEQGLAAAIAYVNDWQTGPNREMLEAHKALIRAQVRNMQDWLRSQGLPKDGRTVVVGEAAEEWARRVRRE